MLLSETSPRLDCSALTLIAARRHESQLYSKKYGVHMARFTHKNTAVIHASTKENGQQDLGARLASPKLITLWPQADDIRYLSVHDKNYIRYYKGHNKK